jgi:hypothetical protein
MGTSIRIAAWNANGLANHVQEIILFLNINSIDIRTELSLKYQTATYTMPVTRMKQPTQDQP